MLVELQKRFFEKMNAARASSSGSPPFPGRKSTESESLSNESSRQIQEYIKLGFHKELGMSEEEYRKSLPTIYPQPEKYKNRFGIPVIVDPRIRVFPQVDLAGFKIDELGCSITETTDRGKNRPETPYVAWMQDGSRNRGKSANEVIEKLKEDELAGNFMEGVALVITHPDILSNNKEIHMAGTIIGSSDLHTLVLRREDDIIWLTDISNRNFNNVRGSITRGV